MIAFVAAVREELSALIKTYRLRQVEGPSQALVYRGPIGSPSGAEADVLVLLTGVGRARAEDATGWLVRAHRPEAIVSTGFGGATSESLSTGTLVLSTTLAPLEGTPLEWQDGVRQELLLPSPPLLARARIAVELAGIDFVQGPTVTIPIIARSPGLKRWRGNTFSVFSVDLESYWVTPTAQAAGVSFLAVRAIVDTVAIFVP